VALIGIVIIRFSNASVTPTTWTAADSELKDLAGTAHRATDSTLPTVNKTVWNGPNPKFGLTETLTLAKGDAVNACYFATGRAGGGTGPAALNMSIYENGVLKNNTNYMNSANKPVPSGVGYYEKYCVTSNTNTLPAGKHTLQYVLDIPGSATGGSQWSVWKVERTIQPAAK
jgi:hypothetical protein